MASLSTFPKTSSDTRPLSPLASSPPLRALTIATLLYLALPLFIFEFGWLRFPFNVLFPLLLASALFVVKGNLWNQPAQQWADAGQKRTFWLCFWWTYLPIAFCTINSGAGGFGDQSYDWHNKHNIVLADLMRYSWPVRYADLGDSFGHGPYNMVYYVAYYIPAASIGKIAGWTGANIALQAWTQSGMLLLSLWIVTLLGPRARWMGLLFCVFAGADQWGQVIGDYFNMKAHGTSMNWQVGANNLWWTHFWGGFGPLSKYYVLFSSHFQQLFWAPQHFLAGCLGCVLFLRPAASNEADASATAPQVFASRGIGFDLLVLSLLPMWSPFAVVGCLPLLIFNAVRAWKTKQRARTPQTASPQRLPSRGNEAFLWFCSLSLLALLGCFLSARLRLSNPPSVGTRGVHLEFLPLQMWHDVGLWTIPAYLLFDALEFGLLLCFAWPLLRGASAAWRGYAAIAGLVLCLLPFFQYGMYNDLVLRSSIPLLLIVCFVVIEALKSLPLRGWRWRQAAIVFLLIGGLGHTYFYGRGMIRNTRFELNLLKKRQFSKMLQIQPTNTIPNLYEEYRHDPRQQLVAQYIGDGNSLFARVFQKR